jgi:hypothetical protein
MRIEINGKKKNIPDIDISKIMKGLEVTKEEAIQIWLEDEGLLINEEQNELDKKAQASGVLRTIHDAENVKVTAKKMTGDNKRKRTVKPQPDKEYIISTIAEMLTVNGATDINIENATKIVTFVYNGAPYKINLTATRTPK